jgi:serine/threonine-protein kinase SRK2
MDKYKFVSDLRAGKYGKARLYEDIRNNEYVVIKFIENIRYITSYGQSEILNHIKLNHPHIIGFKEVFLESDHLCIVMEYGNGGDLYDYIIKNDTVKEKQAHLIFKQIIYAVKYCHDNNICHRDIKPENILMTYRNLEDKHKIPIIKLCDFGLSKSYDMFKPNYVAGTPEYIAPEVLNRKSCDSAKADIWSCGVTLYVMLYGKYPFQDEVYSGSLSKMIKNIMICKYRFPERIFVSRECKDLLNRIFIHDPEKRIDFDGILNHTWFARHFRDNTDNIKNELLKENNKIDMTRQQSKEEIITILTRATIPSTK